MQAGSDGQVDVDDLVRKAQQGGAGSIAALYEHFFDRIFRYVSFKTGSPVEAEDITGDVFVKMLESIRSFKSQGYPFSSWLFRIAHNLVVDYFRKKGRRPQVSLDDAPHEGGTPMDVDKQVELSLVMREVYGAMKGLTKLQREVISLRFAAGLSVAETARAVGKKDNAVKALQHAGLRKLKRLLGSESSGGIAIGLRGARKASLKTRGGQDEAPGVAK